MTRIYGNPGFARRMNGSTVVIVLAVLFGFWEVYAALNPGPDGPGYGFLFAALFIGGGIYGMNQILTDGRDMVTALDVEDATGQATISLWRPFAARRIEGSLERLSGWRPYSKQARNVRTPMLLADHPDHPRPLQFELGRSISFTDRFRALAPEATATFAQDGAAGVDASQ